MPRKANPIPVAAPQTVITSEPLAITIQQASQMLNVGTKKRRIQGVFPL